LDDVSDHSIHGDVQFKLASGLLFFGRGFLDLSLIISALLKNSGAEAIRLPFVRDQFQR